MNSPSPAIDSMHIPILTPISSSSPFVPDPTSSVVLSELLTNQSHDHTSTNIYLELFPQEHDMSSSIPLPIEDNHSVSIHPASSSELVSSTSHTMVTRAKHGIYKPNSRYALLLTCGDIPSEPRSVKVALQHDGWRKAMLDELDALHQNLTWTLVPRDSHMNIIGSI